MFTVVEDLLTVGRAARQLAGRRRDDPSADSDEDVAAREAMQSGMQHFICPCVGLGSKRASLGHKVHAVWHQVFMITGTPTLLQRFCASIAAWTVDLEVESAFNTVLVVSFADMIQRFCERIRWSAAGLLGIRPPL